jgi:RHS repeat-associated protein
MSIITKKYLGLILFCGVGVSEVLAYVGSDNPTGPAGELDRAGTITTGGYISPYTANASRSVTDLIVSGGVGAYPLAFTRISNSRSYLVNDTSSWGQNADFGTAGNWLHSYQWSIDCKWPYVGGKPTKYTVSYEDGSGVTFTASTNGDPYWRGGQGVRDRLQLVWDSSTVGRAYLIRPDGRKVWFSISKSAGNSVQGIIDPYGQTTTVTGSPASGLVTITEPGGRWIKLHYFSPGAWTSLIDYVLASDGRRVDYTYTLDPNGTWQKLVQVTYTYTNNPTLVATYTYQADNSNSGGNPLLRTCVDPMYSGPMWMIGYTYATGVNPDGTGVVYGQIQSENYFDGTNIGAAVSSLTVVNNTTRKETRADGKSRTFTYNTPPPLLTSWTDFKGNSASQTYDSNGYVNSVTDFNGHMTNFTNNAFTGGLLTTTFPSTPADTPPNTPRGVVTYTYGSASCADTNNRDPNNPYYVCTATDEGGHTTTYTRDTAKRIIYIHYPDGGYELSQNNSFGQVTSHTMRTGGTETSTYDARGLLQTYRDHYHATGNPNVWYQYDSFDRVSGTTDTLGSAAGDINHTTNYTYNSRGAISVTTLPVDPNDGQRHTISKDYNLANGTVRSVTDQLGHMTNFTYDDYKRLLTTTTPPRFNGDTMNHTGSVYYDANGTGNDYTHTDANVTHTTSPGGKKGIIVYDENRRKNSITVAVGTSDAATTTFAYDLNGNLTSVVAPKEQPGQQFAGQSTTTTYDERNRPYSVRDPLGNVTSCMYDAAGRKASVTRANGQVVTFDSYDAMNRLLQQTAKQTPDPDAVTKYHYLSSGLLDWMKDPRLVAINSSYSYSYQYDLMGRKLSLTYPPDSGNVQRSESWHYDTAGRIDTFTNRNGNTGRTLYDNLNRAYNIAWDDSGLTPTVTMSYDAASRVRVINNANANISHSYFDDNLLSSETNTYADTTARTVSYTYDPDANRASIQYPNNAYSFTYDYTGRNQLWHVMNNNTPVATYVYDPDGNVTTRTPDNGTSSSYSYDGLDRLTHISHALTGTTRTFDYAYDSVSNRKWTKRDGANGDVFGYDLADQSTSILLNVPNPDTTSPGAQTINYDANGNRTTFSAYGLTDTYTTNNLNQYTQRNSSTATYDTKGNMTAGFDGSPYAYDAQSRLLSATKGGTTETFKYDSLNRQVSRTIGAGSPVYNVYDGWNLIAEYSAGSTSPTIAYLGGVKNLTSNLYYYQDGSGSTSHLSDNTGHLLEWYRYDLQGTPIFYDASNTQISASGYSIRHLFTGQQWYSEIGLYDLRNRFYSPDIGRFVQGDPLGFGGDATNLYRYCGNNPLTRSDPDGKAWFPGAGGLFSNPYFVWGSGFFVVGTGAAIVAAEIMILHESRVFDGSAPAAVRLPGYYPSGSAREGADTSQSDKQPSEDQATPDDVGTEENEPVQGIPPSEQPVEIIEPPPASFSTGYSTINGAGASGGGSAISGFTGPAWQFSTAAQLGIGMPLSSGYSLTVGTGHAIDIAVAFALDPANALPFVGGSTRPTTVAPESAGAGDGGASGPIMNWVPAAAPTLYATGWTWWKDPWKSFGYPGVPKGAWKATGWSTDPALAVPMPTSKTHAKRFPRGPG